jgi:arylsulfatase A-like enzyme
MRFLRPPCPATLFRLAAQLLLAAACLLLPRAMSAAETDPPNILLIIADDWSWPHASVYGDNVVSTPAFNRVAAQGAIFTQAFCASPSCTPSRSSILTGRPVHQLEESGNLWGLLNQKFPVFTTLLQVNGYAIGLQGKGWGPGNYEAGGYLRNPAGPSFKSFGEFLNTVPDGQPFCFWFGSSNPHRPYEKGSGLAAGLDPSKVIVPPYWPDTPEVRNDLLDYHLEVQRFDQQAAEILKVLEDSGRASNTMVIMTSDNGMPFPRAKANLYDAGTRVPLAIRWPDKYRPALVIDSFVNLMDLAPTILDAAGFRPLKSMTGQSLLPLLTGVEEDDRDRVFLERERHAHVREGNLSYPMRAVRTERFLYIRNFHPDRWPAGDPELVHSVGPFGDVDASPTKEIVLRTKEIPNYGHYYLLNFGKRPPEELYDLARDPHQINNVVDDPQYRFELGKARGSLTRWLNKTEDPRMADPDDDRWDYYPYFGGPARAVQTGQ